MDILTQGQQDGYNTLPHTGSTGQKFNLTAVTIKKLSTSEFKSKLIYKKNSLNLNYENGGN